MDTVAAEHVMAAIGTRPQPGRPPLFRHRDRILLALTGLRANLTERALAAAFGVSQPTAH